MLRSILGQLLVVRHVSEDDEDLAYLHGSPKK